MEPIKITRKIVDYSVAKADDDADVASPAGTRTVESGDSAGSAAAAAAGAASSRDPQTVESRDSGDSGVGAASRRDSDDRPRAKVIHMHEKVGRPEELEGSTYKVKTPVSDHAMYVTINDIILNPGTEHENRRPFEIFINSKNLDHYQWIVALTRIISAVFRKGGDVTFLVDELKAVFDPRGGYWKAGGVYMPSIIAELGHVVETHLQKIGLLKSPELDDHRKALIEEKRREFEERHRQKDAFAEESDYPEGAQLCAKCNVAASVMLDGCLTCLNCGESKCG